MADSFELRDELQALQDLDTYTIPHDHDLSSEDPARLLEGAVEAVAESSDAIGDPEVFDVYRSLLKYSDAVPGATMSKLLDSLSSGLQAELDATVRDLDQESAQVYCAHKVPLEMYAFLLQWFVSAAEKVKQADGDGPATPAPKARKPRGGKAAASGRSARGANAKKAEWTWMGQIPATLNLISKVLRLSTQRIWTTTAEKDTFISCLTRPAYHVTESEVYMKVQDIKLSVYKVICLAVKHHGHSFAAQITIIQSLQFYEHLSEPLAECLTILAKEFDHAQLGDEVLREIAGMSFTGQDNKGPRTFSKFLIKFSELAPRLMLKQIALLLGQLDSEAYPMRIGIVEVIGAIIQDLAEAEEDESSDGSQKKQINGLYDLLLERALDVSSYVRTKVLGVLSRLCDMKKAKFPKQRLAVTQAAVGALEDKVATVRKSAAALIVKLLLTHPYGLMYGGMLTLEVWEADYKVLKAELAKIEASVGDGSGQQDAEDEEAPKEKKKSKKAKRSDNSMDVDGEEEDGGDTEPEDEAEDEDDEEEEEEDPSAMSVDAEGGEQQTPKKKKKAPKLQPRKSQIAVDMTDEQVVLETLETNQLLHLRLRKKYYAEGLNFIRQIEGTMETMEKLLGSKNKPEVLEAIEFFRVAHEYKFAKADYGIKKMLHLIWSKDNSNSTSEDGQELKGIRQRLLECYRGLYFEPLPDMEPKAQVNRIAKNMIELTYNATLAELTSLEEMMRIMMDDEQIHPDVIAKLWSVYSISKPLPKAQRQGAIIILGMLALAKRGVLTDHVDVMLKVGLGHLGKADLTLARYTCVALQRLNGSAKKVKGSLLDKTIRIEMDNPIFHKLQEAVEHPSRSKEWFGLAEQAINTAYALGDHPDVLCNDLIKKLTVRAFAPRAKANAEPESKAEDQEPPAERDPDAMDEDQPGDITHGSEESATASPQKKDVKSNDLGDAFELSQLLFVVGHVVIKHIVYLELVEREWKRQKDEKDGAEKQANPRAKDREELDQVAGNAEDEIGERIAGIRETELLYGPRSLLAIYGPMLVHVCGSPHKYKNRTLRAAATLSFSKFLCVSSQFCDQNHMLLFKILETSKNANIRSNIVIALGDVAVSFSSIIDENSNELYKGLSDPDLVVKKNTLMVLTHLILNGMIKVKGQLGEMAKCIEDPETRISDLAKLFFTELSTKDNAIYNNLPDVISHLGIGDHAVDEETFQRTLTYIFSFIEKEKQAESIVEKLCQRFHLSEEPRQWRDIAFCLSLLPFKSERSVKKLIEGLPFYRDKLHEETVFERFTEILNKARQNKSPNKPDTELAEFEQILEDNRMQGAEDRDLEKRVQGKKAAAKKKASKRKGRKKPVEESDPE
ncbi:non-SMC mitotic condensation complex subunit 1-domain-containing protein [Mycena latifolia]|nr:non-SMC mitotic condensation complex subunit 1-domain-containing protein [Mycena latifolia]